MPDSKYIEKAMTMRGQPLCPNCAETIMMTFAERMGLTPEQSRALGTNFGGGMRRGGVCGAVTSALMVLGAMGINDPSVAAGIQKKIRENHDGMIDCADLLRANAQSGGQKKAHCDGMIREAIGLIEEYMGEEG